MSSDQRKSFFITGGGGMGHATARKFAEAGWFVGVLRLRTSWSAAIAIATPRSRLPSAYAASRGSVFIHSFLTSRIVCFGKPLGDVIADAEEDLVGSLSLERRMRHDFIVCLHVELDEAHRLII
jgi:hypothetical protein